MDARPSSSAVRGMTIILVDEQLLGCPEEREATEALGLFQVTTYKD